MTLLRQGGWTRWPTEVPSNRYYSVILWFCNEQDALPLYLLCFLILPDRSAAWSVCVGGMNLFFPCSHGRIRCNKSVKQYLYLPGLFWLGAFHLMRIRRIRNNVFFFLPLFPCTLPPNPFLDEYLIFQNYTAKLHSWGAPEAGSTPSWGCQCRSHMGYDEQLQCSCTQCISWGHFVPRPRKASVLFRKCVCVIRSVWGWDVILFVHFYLLPKSFTGASRDH